MRIVTARRSTLLALSILLAVGGPSGAGAPEEADLRKGLRRAFADDSPLDVRQRLLELAGKKTVAVEVI